MTQDEYYNIEYESIAYNAKTRSLGRPTSTFSHVKIRDESDTLYLDTLNINDYRTIEFKAIFIDYRI